MASLGLKAAWAEADQAMYAEKRQRKLLRLQGSSQSVTVG